MENLIFKCCVTVLCAALLAVIFAPIAIHFNWIQQLVYVGIALGILLLIFIGLVIYSVWTE